MSERYMPVTSDVNENLEEILNDPIFIKVVDAVEEHLKFLKIKQ